jgi:hypothetical protein
MQLDLPGLAERGIGSFDVAHADAVFSARGRYRGGRKGLI